MRPRLLPYTAEHAIRDAKEIVAAIVEDRDHSAIQRVGNKYVITMSKVIPDAENAGKITVSARRRRLRDMIRALMEQHPEFEETRHGSKLAYERRLTP